MVDGSSLLFGQVQQTDKIELLTTLPPKNQVDKLIHHFFDRENFPITIVRKYLIQRVNSPISVKLTMP
jgi:hypothetical protein